MLAGAAPLLSKRLMINQQRAHSDRCLPLPRKKVGEQTHTIPISSTHPQDPNTPTLQMALKKHSLLEILILVEILDLDR